MAQTQLRLVAPLAATLLAAVLLAAVPAQSVNGAWKFDVLHLKNGRSVQGMLLDETPSVIRFHYVRRNPGVPTVAIVTSFDRTEVARVERLSTGDRLELAGRLRALNAHSRDERVRSEQLELRPAPWGQDEKGGLAYRSSYFVLVSNARPDIIRRAALQLEEIYAAYARFVPPRHATAAPTRLRLVRSLAEYQALLRAQGRTLANPAFYDVAANEILCASDLQRLDQLLDEARRQHDDQLARIAKLEVEVRKLRKGPVRDRLVRQIADGRKTIAAANEQNETLFRAATARLFRMLYHEAFHAYLANFVYREDETDVPRWLNEGLAQVFETAFVEAGELRVGHADRRRLERVKATVRQGELFPVADLLDAGPKQFLVEHASDQQESDRAYLTSWALAFYLTFERRLLGTPRMDAYVKVLKQGADARKAFGDLIGQPIPAFEKAFHQYLLSLRPDGSTAAVPK